MDDAQRQSNPLYLNRWPARAVDRVMLIGVRRQRVQPADSAVQYRPFCIANRVPGSRSMDGPRTD